MILEFNINTACKQISILVYICIYLLFSFVLQDADAADGLI